MHARQRRVARRSPWWRRCRRGRASGCPSGSRRAAARGRAATAPKPSPARPTTLMSSSASSRAANPERTRSWSSASGDPDHAPGHAGPGSRARTRNPPPGRGPASSEPPSARARSAIPVSPLPGARAPGAAAALPGRRRHGPVVGYLDLQVGRAVPQQHAGRAAGRVADRVGQRLLDDAVGGGVHPGGQRPHRALGGDRHGEAGRPGPRRQLVQPRHPGHRGQRRSPAGLVRRRAARRAPWRARPGPGR